MNKGMRGLLLAFCLGPTATVLADALPARLDAARHLVMGSSESGLVQRVAIAPGDSVRAGQELLRLDSRGLEARLAESSAAVEAGEARLAEAERERERTQELYDRTLLADHELQLAQIALAEARTRLLAARAQRAELQQRLDQRILRAPWDGRVVAVMVQAGQAVVSHERPTPLLELVAEGDWLAHAEASLAQLRGLETGMALQVEVDGQRHEARVHALGWRPLEVAGEPRYAVTARFSASGQSLRPGMAARIHLP